MARPATRKINLKDGWYIEVSSRTNESGIKIRRETKKEIMELKEQYDRTKHVKLLGKVEDGKFEHEKKKRKPRKTTKK